MVQRRVIVPRRPDDGSTGFRQVAYNQQGSVLMVGETRSVHRVCTAENFVKTPFQRLGVLLWRPAPRSAPRMGGGFPVKQDQVGRLSTCWRAES